MAYVALGRVTDPANLRVAAPGNGKVIVNVVYRDVLAVGGLGERRRRQLN